MKIGLIQGQGGDLVGGGSIQYEYNLWANSQEDVEITNFIANFKTEPKKYDKKEIFGRILSNVVEFNEQSSHKIFNEMDKVIVLTYPFKSTIEKEKEWADWYINTIKEYKSNSNHWWGVICYDYLKDVVLNNLGAQYTELYTLADKVWVNNKENPLITHLKEKTSIKDSQFHIECPQFMADYKHDWGFFEDKNLNTIYYQGRSLDWKGWQYLPTLIVDLNKHNELYGRKQFKAVLNGLDKQDEIVKFYENVSFSNLENKNRFDFNNCYETYKSNGSFDKDINLFGYFSPENAHELTQKMGFSFYFTLLNSTHNFFPEYALIDAIRNGTPLIVPNWYFDEENKTLENNIINVPLEEAGMISYDPSKMSIDSQYRNKFSKKLNDIMMNEELYNLYRQRAYDYMMKNHNADIVIRKFLNA